MERRIPGIRKALWDGVERKEEVVEAVAVASITGVLRQLGELSAHTCDVFQELQAELESVTARTASLSARCSLLQQHFGLKDTVREAMNLPTDAKLSAVSAPPSAAVLLSNAHEPPGVAASLDFCRPPPSLESLDQFATVDETACSLRYSHSDLKALRQRSNGSGLRTRKRAERYFGGSLDHSSSELPSLDSSRDGGGTSGGVDISSPSLPAAEPGGDSPTIGRRGGRQMGTVLECASSGEEPSRISVQRSHAEGATEEDENFYTPVHAESNAATQAFADALEEAEQEEREGKGEDGDWGAGGMRVTAAAICASAAKPCRAD